MSHCNPETTQEPHRTVNEDGVFILPMAPGTYALVLKLSGPQMVRVGRLGEFEFPAGDYCYLGSALGGLRSRVARHLRKDKVEHWHLDYLTNLSVVTVSQVLWSEGRQRLECEWAVAATDLPGATLPVPGFGSSDCSCRSHLVRLDGDAQVALLATAIGGREILLDRSLTA